MAAYELCIYTMFAYPEIAHEFLAFLESDAIDDHKRAQFFQRLTTNDVTTQHLTRSVRSKRNKKIVKSCRSCDSFLKDRNRFEVTEQLCSTLSTFSIGNKLTNPLVRIFDK